ncbi:hypothetical protein Acr_00g0076340 [Actinidia rufa]|uniref:Uncharacterized protein n=1 Tax=Actinidia rufa TaxID=165716 RepID=A0A7J0DT17_9ERIC|nr:hypothetical protein Acr_00g0076340 [Actinidia rufa]
MEDQNEEGRVPNFAPQNPNAMLNPPIGGVSQNPPPDTAHGLGGDNMEGGSIHGGIRAPQFRTLRDYMNPPRQAPSSCIVFPPHYATLSIRPRTQNPEVRLNQQGGKYQLKEVDDVNARLATMARKLEALEFTKVNAVGSEELKEVSCAVYETKEHDTISCPVIPGIKEALHGQVNAISHYGQGGKLPAQPQPNPSRHVHSTEISNQPSSGHEQVQAITVLRSGKTIEKTILPIDPKGRGEASKVVDGTVWGDRETG